MNKEYLNPEKGIYLDNAAAVPCEERYLYAFAEYSRLYPGNQEAMSFHGSRSAAAVREASERLLTSLHGSSRTHEVCFCSTGTECACVAARAFCMTLAGQNRSGGEIVSTPVEHPALLHALERSCRENGLELKICGASRQGVRVEDLEKVLSSRTLGVAVHHVESQTGSILDLKGLRIVMDRICPKALLLADTVQSAGKIRVDLQEEGAPDLMFVSGQKLAVPSCGAVFCRSSLGKEIRALRQKEHFFSRATPGAILTLADALTCQLQDQEQAFEHAGGLGRVLDEQMQKLIPGFKRTLEMDRTSPFIAHYMTMPFQGAILTRALHKYGISVAPGSACESETPGGSAVLSAMGFSAKDSYCCLRFSFSRANTADEIRECVNRLAECVKDY